MTNITYETFKTIAAFSAGNWAESISIKKLKNRLLE